MSFKMSPKPGFNTTGELRRRTVRNGCCWGEALLRGGGYVLCHCDFFRETGLRCRIVGDDITALQPGWREHRGKSRGCRERIVHREADKFNTDDEETL